MLDKISVLAAKIETTVGTAISVSGSDAAFNVVNLEMNPDIQFDQIQKQGGFGQLPAVQKSYKGVCTFSIYAVGGATLPSWATTFLPACGFIDSSDTFSGLAAQPGSSVKTLTLVRYLDGEKQTMRGCAGNAVFNYVTGELIRIDFTFWGAFTAIADDTILTPTYPSETFLRFANATFTIDSYAHKVSRFTLDLGNQLTYREDPTPTDASGIHSAMITGRMPRGSLDPEATLAATKNLYSAFTSRVGGALVCNVGTAGNGINVAAPALQFTSFRTAQRNGIVTRELDFQLNESSARGDELTITIV